MALEQQSAGDPLPPGAVVIEVRVGELKQLFNAMDPSPFRERDLDPEAEEFIVGWAQEASREAPLALLVHVDRPAGPRQEPHELRDAISKFFGYRSEVSRRRLRQLFRTGRTSLVIGLAALATSIAAGDMLAEALSGRRFGGILQESLLIGGWVAMWRPIEIFLYDWWPIRAEVRLYARLSAMPLRVTYAARGPEDAWRSDWPAVPPQHGREPR